MRYDTRMTREEFERLVQKGYAALPEWVRQKISNVALLIEDEPSEDERRTQGLEPDETLLGLYKGVPLSERGESYGIGLVMPDTVTLYQLPIQDAADEDGIPVEQIVAETIWHEFAHHFGMDEHEVRGREHMRSHLKSD